MVFSRDCLALLPISSLFFHFITEQLGKSSSLRALHLAHEVEYELLILLFQPDLKESMVDVTEGGASGCQADVALSASSNFFAAGADDMPKPKDVGVISIEKRAIGEMIVVGSMCRGLHW